jgi:isochorismate hydrolase
MLKKVESDFPLYGHQIIISSSLPDKWKKAEYFRELVHPIIAHLKKIIDAARKTHTPLFFAQHGHEPDEDKGMLGRWRGDSIIMGNREARLLGELNLSSQDIVVEKNRRSAFYRAELEKKLKEHKIEDIVFGGVMTNLCCETTARDTLVRDYTLFLLTALQPRMKSFSSRL